MVKDSEDFLTTEYEQIAQAFFQASTQTSTLFSYYITLITAPITFIVAIFGFVKPEGLSTLATFSIDKLPNFVGFIVLVISIAGFLMSIIISDTRFDAILYARTVNKVRAYFAGKDPQLKKYLRLPIRGDVPKYDELFDMRAMGAELILIAILDSAFLFVALVALTATPLSMITSQWYFFIVLPVLFGAIHLLVYWRAAKKRLADDQDRSAGG